MQHSSALWLHCFLSGLLYQSSRGPRYAISCQKNPSCNCHPQRHRSRSLCGTPPCILSTTSRRNVWRPISNSKGAMSSNCAMNQAGYRLISRTWGSPRLLLAWRPARNSHSIARFRGLVRVALSAWRSKSRSRIGFSGVGASGSDLSLNVRRAASCSGFLNPKANPELLANPGGNRAAFFPSDRPLPCKHVQTPHENTMVLGGPASLSAPYFSTS